MAHITILKHTRDKNFRLDFMKWVKDKNLVEEFNILREDVPELLKVVDKFSMEVDLVQSIRENSNFITNFGLHHIASKLLENFIKNDTHYVIIDNVEVFKDDHMLVILTD